MTVWTNKQVAFFSERWAAGDTYRQIADAMAERGWPVRSEECLKINRFRLGLPTRDIASNKPRKRNKYTSPWNDELVALLRKLHAEGVSYARIAKQLGNGITRSAAIGKGQRLGLFVSPDDALRRQRVATKRGPRQPQWSSPAPRATPAPKPRPVVAMRAPAPRPPKPRQTDPAALIAEALLAQCANAERRRSQYRAQPNGALRAR